MNGAFTFASDKAFNAADPSTYPERLTIRVPVPSNLVTPLQSYSVFAQDKWKATETTDAEPGAAIRRRSSSTSNSRSIRFSPVTTPVDKNNLPAARRVCLRPERSVGHSRRDRALLREALQRSSVSSASEWRVRRVVHRQFPRRRRRPWPEQRTAAHRSDARRRSGREPRAAQPALSAGNS